MPDYPSMKARELFRLLTRAPLGYSVVRQSGSHRILTAEGRPRLIFAFHDAATVPGRIVRTILTNDVGLTDDEARELL